MTKLWILAGSAALVIAAPANAADAVVVAEPEPVEFVRVCDVYGTGFFYIPGTDTCLRIGGYVRYDIGIGDLIGSDVDGDGKGDTYFQRSRFAIRTDARRQTEMGDLRAYAQINFDFDMGGSVWSYRPDYGTSHQLYVNHAYIELGGFRVGVTDSAFSTITDFAGNVANDWLLGYGPFQTNQILYTFTGSNGFAATFAAESGSGAYSIDSYMPHLVAGASLTQGWGKVSAVAGYDSVNEVWAGKARLDVKITDGISVFAMAGYKSDADTPNFYGRWGGDWAVWAGGSARVSEKAVINTQFSFDDASNLVAVGNIDYEVVEGFKISPEVVYTDNIDVDGSDSLGGFIRFQRTF